MLVLEVHFEDFKGKRALLIDCQPSQVSVYLNTRNDEKLIIRAGGSSARLALSQMHDFSKQRFAFKLDILNKVSHLKLTKLVLRQIWGRTFNVNTHSKAPIDQ